MSVSRDGIDRHSAQRRQAVDRQVAQAIRLRRCVAGLSQEQLAKLVGVTVQQAHKYETGVNRITAGRLHTIAQALDCDVAALFDDQSAIVESPQHLLGFIKQAAQLTPSQQQALNALMLSSRAAA